MDDFDLTTTLRQARRATTPMRLLSGARKNKALYQMAQALRDQISLVLEANTLDLENLRGRQLPAWITEGGKLTPERLQRAATQLERLATLPDPVGALDHYWQDDEGAQMARYRVPLGVLALVYEIYPEWVILAIGMALKAGNSLIAACQEDLASTHTTLVTLLSRAAYQADLPESAIQGIPGDHPDDLGTFLRWSRQADAVITYGRSEWLAQVQDQSTAPVIGAQLGQGYITVAGDAAWELAKGVILHPRVSPDYGLDSSDRRPLYQPPPLGMVLLKAWVEPFGDRLLTALTERQYFLQGDEASLQATMHPILHPLEADVPAGKIALRVQVVADLPEAIAWVNKNSLGQVETLLTESSRSRQQFQQGIMASVLHFNAPPIPNLLDCTAKRLSLGVATQKFHTRGHIRLQCLTTVQDTVTELLS